MSDILLWMLERVAKQQYDRLAHSRAESTGERMDRRMLATLLDGHDNDENAPGTSGLPRISTRRGFVRYD
jgi:hypothetical protein